jgi:peptidoglycan/LPS O-acetylase OafA/YrhL
MIGGSDPVKCKINYIATIVQPVPTIRVSEVARPRPEYFPALTGLRFFLALWVVFHHLVSKGMMLEAWSYTLPVTARVFLEQGHVAVRTFFVLSGFVLARGYANSDWKRRDIVSYGIARIARVYPVYAVSLLLISTFVYEFLSSPGVTARGKLDALAAYGFVLQGWMPEAGAGWNTPAWSLSCEFMFYLCLPMLLVWLGDRSWWKLGALIFIAMALPLALKRVGAPASWKPLLHLGDFLVGIAAARIYGWLRTPGRNWKGSGYRLYVPAMVGALGVLIAGTTADLGTALRPLNGMLVIGLALGGGAIERFLSTASAQYLGQASYSLYILHVPLLWWFGNRGPAFLRGLNSGVAIIYILGIVAVSAMCFEWVEKPANRALRDWGRRAVPQADG